MIRKYKSFLEARIDLYREMWERGFDEKRVSQLLKGIKEFVKRNNLPQATPLYNPGVYFFETIGEAQEDQEKRLKQRIQK